MLSPLENNFLNTLPMFNHQKIKLQKDIQYIIDSGQAIYIEKIYLFGSCSNGLATVKSDIDLGIVFKENTPREVLSDIRVELNVPTELGVETNIVEVPEDNSRFKQEILKGRLIYEP